MEINCKNCSNPFEVKESAAKRGDKKFCSKNCRFDYIKNERRLKVNKKFNGKIELPLDFPFDVFEKFKAKCKIHGEFETTITYLRLNKYGCQICGGAKQLIINDSEKECTKCKEVLSLDKFFKYKRDDKYAISHECIECKRNRQRGRTGQKQRIKYGAEYMKNALYKHRVKTGKMFEFNGLYFKVGLKTDLNRNFCNFCTRISLDKNVKSYCSDNCSKEGQLASIRIKRLIRRINGVKNNYTEKNCIDCNALFKSSGKRCKQCSDFNKKVNEKITKDKTKIVRRARMDIKAESINSYAVFKKDNWTCRMCSTKVQKVNIYANDAAELDHIIPISKGGTHTLDNVQTLCRQCNQFKSDKMPDDLDLINYIKRLKNKEIRGIPNFQKILI